MSLYASLNNHLSFIQGKFFLIFIICLFLAVCLFLSCCGAQASHCGSFSCGAGLQSVWASVAAARALSSCGSLTREHRGSVVGTLGLCCSVTCGIFPDQGSYLCHLHWQADSLPLSHQRRPPGKNFNEYLLHDIYNIGHWGQEAE